MNEKQIIDWLREEDDQKLEILWRLADETRIAHVGDQVHLRGLIEVSNICARRCGYCGISADNRQIQRYRMTEEEIMDCVQRAVGFGYGTVVMQAGEDYGIMRQWMANIIRRIKAETPLAVTLSLGERPDHINMERPNARTARLAQIINRRFNVLRRRAQRQGRH